MKLVGIPHRLCLLDFEILCRLKAVHGIAARSVLLVDPLYAVAFGDDAGRHARVCDEALNEWLEPCGPAFPLFFCDF